MKACKVWGEARLLFRIPGVKISEATLYPSSFCSWHHHATEWNGFYVAEGEVIVEARRPSGLRDRTILRPGDFHAVRPGEQHRFVTGDMGAVVLEIYWPDLSLDDIQRESNGGSQFGYVGLPGEPEPAPSMVDGQAEAPAARWVPVHDADIIADALAEAVRAEAAHTKVKPAKHRGMSKSGLKKFVKATEELIADAPRLARKVKAARRLKPNAGRVKAKRKR